MYTLLYIHINVYTSLYSIYYPTLTTLLIIHTHIYTYIHIQEANIEYIAPNEYVAVEYSLLNRKYIHKYK